MGRISIVFLRLFKYFERMYNSSKLFQDFVFSLIKILFSLAIFLMFSNISWDLRKLLMFIMVLAIVEFFTNGWFEKIVFKCNEDSHSERYGRVEA